MCDEEAGGNPLTRSPLPFFTPGFFVSTKKPRGDDRRSETQRLRIKKYNPRMINRIGNTGCEKRPAM